MKIRLEKINQNHYLKIDQAIMDLLELTEESLLKVRTDGKSLIFTIESEQNQGELSDSLPPLPTTPALPESECDAAVLKQQLEDFWMQAAKEGMREKFMGSLRPILRAKYGYDYSEMTCEKEAMKLCRKYYLAKQRGETLGPPYLPEI